MNTCTIPPRQHAGPRVRRGQAPSPLEMFIDPQLGGARPGPSIFPSTSHVLSCSTRVGLMDDVRWAARTVATDPSVPTACTETTHTVAHTHLRTGPSSCNRHVKAARMGFHWANERNTPHTRRKMADRKSTWTNWLMMLCHHHALEPTRIKAHIPAGWMCNYVDTSRHGED